MRKEMSLLKDANGKRIAVIGGDGKYIKNLGNRHKNSINLDTYEGSVRDTDRLINSVYAGKTGLVVILTRWMSHSKTEKLKVACIKCTTQLVLWTRGVNSLSKELVNSYVTSLEQKGVLQVETNNGNSYDIAKRFEEDELNLPVAVAAAVTVADPKKALEVSPKERVSVDQVLEAMMLEPTKEWTGYELMKLLDLKTQLGAVSLHSRVSRMIKQGKLVITHQGGRSKKSDRKRFMLATVMQAPILMPVEMSSEKGGWLVLNGVLTKRFNSKEEALQAMDHNSELFKSIKTKVRVIHEIEE